VSVSSPELASILKRVSSSSEIVRSYTPSLIEVVFDSSGYSLKFKNKCVKHKIAHKCSDKNISAPSFANPGVTVETVDISVKFRLKKSTIKKFKKDDSDESDSSEAESVTIKRKSKRTRKKWLYPKKYDGTTPLSIFLTNVARADLHSKNVDVKNADVICLPRS